MLSSRWLVSFILVFALAPALFAHEIGIPHEEYDDANVGEQFLNRALTLLIVASIIVLVCTVIALTFHERLGPVINWILFLGIAIPVVVATVYSAGSTIYLNQLAETRGPVHWHADFEIWVCDKSLDISDPTGLMNRIGTPVLHEHNDNRIHVEGVPIRKRDASLGRFFHVIGGILTSNTLGVPTQHGHIIANNGERCPDGQQGIVQVFRWTVQDRQLVQHKLGAFPHYVLAPESMVPPGDCLIIEFGPERQSTNHLCASYRAALNRGEIYGS